MTTFTPQKISWLHDVQANPICDSLGGNTSKGHRKLRVNLVDALNLSDELNEKSFDISNQFFIAVSGGEGTYKDNRKTAFLPGRVAVKIGETKETEGVETQYRYVFLNLNSLSKRLNLKKDDIKTAEKEGELHTLIKVRMKELANEQISIGEILKKFINKKDLLVNQIFKNVAEEENEKKKIGVFIKEHFSDDTFLMERFDDFLENPWARDYLKRLIGKLWWRPKHRALQDLPLEKIALPKNEVVYGTAASRPDNKGTREINRLSLISWDTDNRYAVALEEDFLYSAPPENCSNNQIALKASGNPYSWLVINKNSLKRVGITKKDLAELNPIQASQLFITKLEGIHKTSEKIHSFAPTLLGKKEITLEEFEELKLLVQEHPDEKLKSILQQFLREFDKKKEEWTNELKVEATNKLVAIITELEEAKLIQSE
jgi:hypothetical protein